MAYSNSHKPSALKQQNKKHRVLGHRTKGQVKTLSQGCISIKTLTKSAKNELSKKQRKQQCKQIRSNKRDKTSFKKNQIGTDFAPPFLVTVISANEDINLKTIVNSLSNIDNTASSNISQQGILHFSHRGFKQRFSFIIPPQNDLYAILDAVKVSDTILVAWELGREIRSFAENLFSCLKCQGLPSIMHAVIDEDCGQKKRVRLLKEFQCLLSNLFPNTHRPFFLNKPEDGNLLLRQIGSQKRQSVFYRDHRCQIIADDLEFETKDSSSGTLKLYGYIRGQPLSVNQLLHIPGWGDFQMDQIDTLADPYSTCAHRKTDALDDTPNIFEKADPDFQEQLETFSDVELSDDDEKTWPTEEEMRESLINQRNVTKRKLPKGTSDIQSAWVIDSDDDELVELSDDGEKTWPTKEEMRESLINQRNGTKRKLSKGTSDTQAACTIDSDDELSDDDETIWPTEEEMGESLINQSNVTKAALEDSLFPDEIDTPMDLPARLRFQKYRGLQSFRTSTWDPKENLPSDYKKVVYFKNFEHTKRKIFKADKDGVSTGRYVLIHVKDVPHHLFLNHLKSMSPLVAFALLPYEQKTSVVNLLLKSHSQTHDEPIQSKERLIFHVGFRRFSNSPIFSEHTSGNKHKFVRYFEPGGTVVASMFAPITFPPCPVAVFKENSDFSQTLIASGQFLSADPNRIVCKRVVLSGHPFRISRKSAVVRYMFFNAEDVLWFKSVELRTKWGRRGHIKESLGTHGHMKCQFDGQLKSQDTVLLNLYKRVFPKWRFDPVVERPLLSEEKFVQNNSKEDDMDLDMSSPCKKKKVHFASL